MKYLLVLLFIQLYSTAFGAEKTIIKYKKYEKFDLGSMEIKGKIVAPGDLSVKERSRKVFNEQMLNRTHMLDLIKEDIEDLR